MRPQKQNSYHQRKHFVKTNRKPTPLTFDQLFQKFKKKIERSGILQEVNKREYYEKPSAKRRRKKKEAIRKQELREDTDHRVTRGRMY